MKKILIAATLLLLITRLSMPKTTRAWIGQCCSTHGSTTECSQESGPETCTGPYDADCDPTGTGSSLYTCAGVDEACNPDGTHCEWGVQPDPCCNGCKSTGDPYPYDYTCGGASIYTPPEGESGNGSSDGEVELFCPGGGLNTAIGCIPINDTSALIGFILGWAIGIGGGIAFLLVLFAGFQIMTSSGNPDRLKAGQELMTSAIAGLILLIFSVFILKIIGVDILDLPEFGQ